MKKINLFEFPLLWRQLFSDKIIIYKQLWIKMYQGYCNKSYRGFEVCVKYHQSN